MQHIRKPALRSLHTGTKMHHMTLFMAVGKCSVESQTKAEHLFVEEMAQETCFSRQQECTPGTHTAMQTLLTVADGGREQNDLGLAGRQDLRVHMCTYVRAHAQVSEYVPVTNHTYVCMNTAYLLMGPKSQKHVHACWPKCLGAHACGSTLVIHVF